MSYSRIHALLFALAASVSANGNLAAARVQSAPASVQPQGGHDHAIAPDHYSCPMHCAGGKTYDQPGKCPVCGMNLQQLTALVYAVDVKVLGGASALSAGKPATLLLTLKDPASATVTKLEVVHEKVLHLLLASRDLSFYSHEHPELQPDGTFKLTFTFPAPGEYVLYHDFTPPGVGMQVVQAPVIVPGVAPAAIALKPDAAQPKTIDGYTVTLDTGGPLATGGAAQLAYTITRDGKPITDLVPYLGAMGHLVIISQDRQSFVHSHPHGNGKTAGPTVVFAAHFGKPGLYKGWAQFQHLGKVITVPFTFPVTKGMGDGPPPVH